MSLRDDYNGRTGFIAFNKGMSKIEKSNDRTAESALQGLKNRFLTSEPFKTLPVVNIDGKTFIHGGMDPGGNKSSKINADTASNLADRSGLSVLFAAKDDSGQGAEGLMVARPNAKAAIPFSRKMNA